MRHAPSSRRLSGSSTRRWAAAELSAATSVAEHAAYQFGTERFEEGLEAPAVHESLPPARLLRGLRRRRLRSRCRRLIGGGLRNLGLDLLVRRFPVFGLTVGGL